MEEAAMGRQDQSTAVKTFRYCEKVEEEINTVNMHDICRSDVAQDTWCDRIAWRPPKWNPYDFNAVDRLVGRQTRIARRPFRSKKAIQRYHSDGETAFDLAA